MKWGCSAAAVEASDRSSRLSTPVRAKPLPFRETEAPCGQCPSNLFLLFLFLLSFFFLFIYLFVYFKSVAYNVASCHGVQRCLFVKLLSHKLHSGWFVLVIQRTLHDRKLRGNRNVIHMKDISMSQLCCSSHPAYHTRIKKKIKKRNWPRLVCKQQQRFYGNASENVTYLFSALCGTHRIILRVELQLFLPSSRTYATWHLLTAYFSWPFQYWQVSVVGYARVRLEQWWRGQPASLRFNISPQLYQTEQSIPRRRSLAGGELPQPGRHGGGGGGGGGVTQERLSSVFSGPERRSCSEQERERRATSTHSRGEGAGLAERAFTAERSQWSLTASNPLWTVGCSCKPATRTQGSALLMIKHEQSLRCNYVLVNLSKEKYYTCIVTLTDLK